MKKIWYEKKIYGTLLLDHHFGELEMSVSLLPDATVEIVRRVIREYVLAQANQNAPTDYEALRAALIGAGMPAKTVKYLTTSQLSQRVYRARKEAGIEPPPVIKRQRKSPRAKPVKLIGRHGASTLDVLMRNRRW